MTEDVVQDGYESGYDDDPVEVVFGSRLWLQQKYYLIILIEKAIFDEYAGQINILKF